MFRQLELENLRTTIPPAQNELVRGYRLPRRCVLMQVSQIFDRLAWGILHLAPLKAIAASRGFKRFLDILDRIVCKGFREFQNYAVGHFLMK